MEKPRCLICDNTKLIDLDEFDSKAFVKHWSDYYKIDVSGFFPVDKFYLKKCTECSLEFFSPSVPADTKVYDKLQELDWYYESDKDEFYYAAGVIAKHNSIKNILDVGCGEGLFLKKFINSYEVAGLEIAEKSIEKLKKAGLSTDVGGRKYDFITAFQVLEHVETPGMFIENILSKLNKGGYLFITVPNPDSNFIKETLVYLDFPPHHITRWKKSAFEYIANKYGLEILEYYLEPLRIEHYNAIINERRSKSIQSRVFNNVVLKKIFSFFDKLIMPYTIDLVNYSGHSHGVLFKNKN